MKIKYLLILTVALMYACSQPAKEQTAESEQKPEPVMEPATISMKLINPNRASAEELGAVAELDESTVNTIIDSRPFSSIMELDAILSGALSDSVKTEVYKQLFVPLNLNTASEAEIKMIPGVGNKMAHEFEEYRPYVKMAQFRKEIGKYVDENEVNRLAMYVFVPVNLNTASDEEILAIPGVGDKMLHEFKEYRPYDSIEKFRREIGKYVSEEEVAMFERYVTIE